LAAVLALTAYVPFEWMAKVSLLIGVWMFVVDPLPPMTRLLSMISTLMVLLLTKWYRHAVAEREKEESVGMVNVQVEVVEGQQEAVEGEESKKKQ
jgi:membrane protein implicated in regulation of membrane protease activity